MSILDATEEFMRSGGQLDDIGFSKEHNNPTRVLRSELLREEYHEYVIGEELNDEVEVADGLLDIIVVAWGSLVSYFGLELAREMADSVGASNLSKVQPDGTVLKREDGKILKPEGYFKPRIKEILDTRVDE